MLASVSLSEVLARVCLKTWDSRTILLPGRAIWVLWAILVFFTAPSTGVHTQRTRRLSKKCRRTGTEEVLHYASPQHPTFLTFVTSPQRQYLQDKKLLCRFFKAKLSGYLVVPRLVSSKSVSRPSFQKDWVPGCYGDRRVACSGWRSGWVPSSQLVSGGDLRSAACGRGKQLCHGKRNLPGAGPGWSQPPGISGRTQLKNQLNYITRFNQSLLIGCHVIILFDERSR